MENKLDISYTSEQQHKGSKIDVYFSVICVLKKFYRNDEETGGQSKC